MKRLLVWLDRRLDNWIDSLIHPVPVAVRSISPDQTTWPCCACCSSCEDIHRSPCDQMTCDQSWSAS